MSIKSAPFLKNNSQKSINTTEPPALLSTPLSIVSNEFKCMKFIEIRKKGSATTLIRCNNSHDKLSNYCYIHKSKNINWDKLYELEKLSTTSILTKQQKMYRIQQQDLKFKKIFNQVLIEIRLQMSSFHSKSIPIHNRPCETQSLKKTSTQSKKFKPNKNSRKPHNLTVHA